MRTIPASFRFGGFDYKLLKRSGLICLLEQTKADHKAVTYEVVRLQIRPERFIQGRKLEAGEYMPTSAEWGTHGFTCQSLPAAEKRFTLLCGERGESCSEDEQDFNKHSSLKT